MRKPKYQGTGIYVHSQPFKNLVKGDTFFDADFGYVTWKGKKKGWVQTKEKKLVKIIMKSTSKRMGGK